jgi:putative DNA primase/helicase
MSAVEDFLAVRDALADNDGLPDGFELRPSGVWRSVEKDGRLQWVWLCSPLRVLALPRDRAGTGWGRLVEVTDADGTAHRWAIPARMFAGDGAELRAGLFDLGLTLASGAQARHILADLLQRWQPDARAVTSDRMGWSDESCAAFLLGDGRVIGADDVVFQHETTPAAAAEMKPAGTAEGWRETVAAACVGNGLMVAAVSLAFAGPLLEPLGLDGGGFHLRGASSRGKSTVQRVAVSVWGSPRFLHSWRATANGLEGVASACNGSLLALDELGELSGREAGAAAYMLANGTGKARATRAGMSRAPARWRVMVLSSGKITLADKMAEAGGRAAAGQAVRLLDVVADDREHGAFDVLHDARDGAAFADRVREATATHYGTAGPAFVRAFVANRAKATATAHAAIANFRALAAERFDLDGEGQTERATARLGLVAAAGEMATKFGLTGWPPGAARDAALDVLARWLDGRGGAGSAEARDAVERVRAFLVAHGDSRFEPVARDADRAVINRAGWRDDGVFYVSVDAWREIHKGADPARAARDLHEAGFLAGGDGRNLAVRLPRGVPGRPRAYAVRDEIMGAGHE